MRESELRRRSATLEESSTLIIHNSNDSSAGLATNVIRLCKYSELPEWQKDNHYILDGYVKETTSFQKCFHSLFYLHNESVNIYSHLIPGIVAVLLSYIYSFHYLPVYASTSLQERAVILQFFLGLSSCLCLSSTFHCFKCHSLRISKFGNRLDYLGIIILISTSLISVIYFAYWDNVSDMISFISLTGVLGSICTVMTLNTKFSSNEWRPTRALMFVLFGLSGIFPIFFGIFKFGFEEASQRSQMKYMVLEGFLYIFGAFLYAIRFPERTNPGKYDIFGSSHQIFHVLVVLASVSHATGLIKCYEYCHESTIPNFIIEQR